MRKLILGLVALGCVSIAGLFASGIVKADWGGWQVGWGPNPNWTGGGNYYSTWDEGVRQQAGQDKYVPPCDPNQVDMQVSPQPVYEGQSVTFYVSGSQGSTWIDDQWWGGVDCVGTFWGTKQCKAVKAGTHTWIHTWRNTAENDFNTASNLCSKAVNFTVIPTAPVVVQYIPVYYPVYHQAWVPQISPTTSPTPPPQDMHETGRNVLVIHNMTAGAITLEGNFDGDSRGSMGSIRLQPGQSYSYDYGSSCSRSYTREGDYIDYWVDYKNTIGIDQAYASLTCGGSKTLVIRD